MKSIVRRLLICVALGVVLTITVAWTPSVADYRHRSVLRAGMRVSEPSDGIPAGTLLTAQSVRGSLTTCLMFGASDHSARVRHSLGVIEPVRASGPKPEDVLRGWERWGAWSRFLAKARQSFGPAGVSANSSIEACGWPCRALWCEYTPSRADEYRWDVRGGAFVIPGRHRFSDPAMMLVPNTLPYYPIWSGLATNLAFWSLAAAPFVFAPALVRRLRRRPGTCPACRYDLRGLSAGAPCPECGGKSE